MAKEQVEEGTREAGEQIPTNDDHVAAAALKAIQVKQGQIYRVFKRICMSNRVEAPELTDVPQLPAKSS